MPVGSLLHNYAVPCRLRVPERRVAFHFSHALGYFLRDSVHVHDFGVPFFNLDNVPDGVRDSLAHPDDRDDRDAHAKAWRGVLWVGGNCGEAFMQG